MRSDPPPLSFWESLDMGSRFAVRLAAPPVGLWIALHVIRTAFETPTVVGSFIRPDATIACFVTNIVAFVVFWLVQSLLLRTPSGHILLHEAARLQGLNPEPNQPPGLVFCLFVLMGTVAGLPLPFLACSDIPLASGRSFCIAFLTLWANVPLLCVLFKTTTLFHGHRDGFLRRRYVRLDALRQAEEARRRQTPVVVPVTFESQLKQLTEEHHQRVSQLKLLPIDEEERAYLIELEVARFREAIRSLTDPSFSPASHAPEN